MIVHNIVGTESHPTYEQLATENLARQYSFLRSIVQASISVNEPMLSIEVVKALNYHAISCLHSGAGEFRPCQVTVGAYTPPPHYLVPSLMQMFTNRVNRSWESADPFVLAAWVLWQLNWIHPFINGNGRTARVACYLVLCLKTGSWLPGDVILPELIRQNRPEYVAALQAADASAATGGHDLSLLHTLLVRLVNEQLAGAAAADAAAAASAAADAAAAAGAPADATP